MATANAVSYTVGSGQRVYGGTFPAGAAGALSGGATLGDVSASGSVVGYTAPPGTVFTTLQLAGTDGAARPFAVGHAFRDGDIPAGASIVMTGGSVAGQATILTTWPNGSAKVALLAGTATISGGAATLSLASGATASGAALTTTNLRTAMTQPVSIDAGAFGSVSWTGADWDAPFQTWVSGPRMSSWVYRKPLPSDAHLVGWLEVRLWDTGAVEVLPWVENAYLTVASPTNKSATYTFTMGGTTRFSQLIDIKHHTRIPLINTTTGEGGANSFAHYLGTDPSITVAHDTAYMRDTKLVPNVAWGTPAGATLTALPQAYEPNTLANDETATGAGGGSGSVISAAAAYYIASSGDARAYRAMLAHGFSAGSWPHHFRDSATTPNLPFKFSDYPNVSISGTSTPTMPVPTGGENYSGGYTYTALSHLPAWAYAAFLITGRWWFLEEQQFLATLGYIYVQRDRRFYADGFYNDSIQNRMRAWGLNALAQALAITPTTHPLHTELKASWEANTDRTRRKFVDGTLEPGAVSPQGHLGDYSNYREVTGIWWGAPWQSNYQSLVWGHASNLGLNQSAQSALDHTAVRNHAYLQQITRASDGLSGRYNWRHFCMFDGPIADDVGGIPTNWYTGAQTYAALLAAIPGTAPAAAMGLTLLGQDTVTDDVSGGSIAYLASAQAALALAVEHGVSGAAEGYARITSASNFRSSQDSFLLTNRPDWGVVPRTPAWLAARLAGMAAGDWLNASATTNVGTLSDTTGPNAPAGVAWLESDGGKIATDWAGKITALSSSMVLTGSAAGYSSWTPAGEYSKAMRFDLATGLFSSQWNPIARNMAHVWDANPSRPLNGYVYRRAYNDNILFRADVLTMTWTAFCELNTLSLGIVSSIDVFPTLGTQGSIIIQSNGKLCRVDIATATYSGATGKTVISAALPGVVGGYAVCCYQPSIDAVIAGGGDTTPFPLHKLSNVGGLTQLTTTAPGSVTNIGPNGAGAATVFVPDPSARPYAWLFDFTNTLGVYRLDLVAGTWGARVALPGTAPDINSCVGSIPGSGAFIVFDGRGRSGGASLSRLWLYKAP